MKILSEIGRLCQSDCTGSNISQSAALAIVFTPLLLVLLFGSMLLWPQTREAVLGVLQENKPVEVLTFVFLLVGGLLGLRLSWRVRSEGRQLLVWAFYALFSLGLIFVAMEEIAWGQQFLGFQTPEMIKSVNMQGELTLHNIRGLQGRSELFRLVFGVGGLVGIWMGLRSWLPEIAVPSLLFSWFLLITVFSAIDVYNDYFPIQEDFDYGMQRMSELIEMLIGVAGFLYVWLMSRKLISGIT